LKTVREVAVALALAAATVAVTANEGSATMLGGMSATAQAAVELDNLQTVAGRGGGFHGAGARAGGARIAGPGSRVVRPGGVVGGGQHIVAGGAAHSARAAVHGANVNLHGGHVRPWVKRPWYGTWIAGVALGAVVVGTAASVVPAAPAPGLCWYWTDSSETRGYWDYCAQP
jgi:hypothetical protein